MASDMASNMEIRPLSRTARFYVYALHGFATEVMFTAGWDFIVNQNWKFPGNTSIWSFFIYGMSCMLMEQMYHVLRDRVPLIGRAIIYTLWSFVWEFFTGLILQQFNACAWDYTIFDYHFMGLVTPLYAPAWFFGGLVLDYVGFQYIFQLHWGPKQIAASPSTVLNGAVKQKSLWLSYRYEMNGDD